MIKLKRLIRENEEIAKIDAKIEALYPLWKAAMDKYQSAVADELKAEIDALGVKRDKIRDEDPYLGDKHAFMKHHRTGHIASDAYSRYEEEGGLSWLGNKSKYPILIASGKFGKFDVEFRQTGETLEYTKVVNGEVVRDAAGHALSMTPEEIKAQGLPEKETTVVAFVGDTPVGHASNEFGTVGVWVEGPYQKSGIGVELMDLHIQQRPTFKTKQGKIGQMTYAGQSMVGKYYDKMVKRHGLGWFNKLKID